MTDYDAFNGDADGICALIQLRLDEPRPDAHLVTGVKRDIQLLNKVEVQQGDRVTALDISFDKNRDSVNRIVAAGGTVFFCDHHFAGEVPDNEALEALISTAPEVCTSALINGRLRGRFAEWAVVGCYGDNLDTTAAKLADNIGVKIGLETLKRLGILVNYNAYGATPDDLHFKPEDLYSRMSQHKSPSALLADDPSLFETLDHAYESDMDKGAQAPKIVERPDLAVVSLPDAPWARRVSGVLGNDLANAFPDRAHAVLTDIEGGYLVSVRAPLNRRSGADEVCRQFETGGGRSAAAGINKLPQSELNRFIDVMGAQYG